MHRMCVYVTAYKRRIERTLQHEQTLRKQKFTLSTRRERDETRKIREDSTRGGSHELNSCRALDATHRFTDVHVTVFSKTAAFFNKPLVYVATDTDRLPTIGYRVTGR